MTKTEEKREMFAAVGKKYVKVTRILDTFSIIGFNFVRIKYRNHDGYPAVRWISKENLFIE